VTFAYYRRLTATQKATYRRSDEIRALAVPDAASLTPLVERLEVSLASGKRLATAKASSALVLALCQQLRVPPVVITVRTVRPELPGGELHGLYTFAEEGTSPTIEVWMSTAAQKRVVRFRTFLRTLLHEMVHHVDVTLLGLPDSFHTEGFYQRESSVMRQLAGRPRAKPEKVANAASQQPVQLGLFSTG